MTEFVRASLALGLFWFAPILLAAVILYFIVTIPARRNERIELFLDLLRDGIRDGRTPEEIIVAVSKTRDRSLGARLHLLAAYVEEGHRLLPALFLVPGFLPPSIIGFLRAGAETGRLIETIGVARRTIGRSITRTATSIHYAFVILVVMLPFAAIVLPSFRIFIWPRMQQIMVDMEIPIPPFSALVVENSGWFVAGYFAIALLCFAIFVLQLSAPKLLGNRGGLLAALAAVWHQLKYALPWTRKLLQRDFSLTLALLLDAEMPEKHAFARAGEATGNRYLIARANRVSRQLASGLPLGKAVAAFDDTGEFQWRMANALNTRNSFVDGLRGWHKALESEAFRREETAAHLVTTALLIVNGLIIAAITSAMFLLLIAAIKEGVAW